MSWEPFLPPAVRHLLRRTRLAIADLYAGLSKPVGPVVRRSRVDRPSEPAQASPSLQRYLRLHAAREAAAAPGGSAVHAVTFAKSRVTLNVPEAQTLLEAGLQAGLRLPFSCSVGGCGSCRQTVRSGEVILDEPNCLLPAERKAGAALLCVARAKGPVVVEA